MVEESVKIRLLSIIVIKKMINYITIIQFYYYYYISFLIVLTTFIKQVLTLLIKPRGSKSGALVVGSYWLIISN